jgi:hypothetical protein
MLRNRRALAFTLLLLAITARAFAAADDSISSNVATATSQGVNAASSTIPVTPLPPKVQEDIGDIRPVENAPVSSYFHFQATINTQYTSNAALYHSHDDADFLIAPVVQGSFSAPLNKYFRLNLGVRIEDYSYMSNQSVGFWGFSGYGNVEWRYRPSWPRIYVGTEPYYYFAYANGDRLTAAVGPVAGIDQTLSINRGKTFLLMGYHFGDYFSSPSSDTRQSHTVTLALTQQIKRDLYGQVYWQLQYSDYNVYGRDELRDVIGVGVIHQFTPTTFISFFANYVDNASNNSLAKYTNVNAGAAMEWQY